jgi:hypothetical protein
VSGVLLAIAAAVGVVFFFRRRPAGWIIVGFCTAVLLPRAATQEWFASAGALAQVPPSAWVFAAGLASALVTRRTTGPEGGRAQWLTAGTMAWVLAAAALAYFLTGTNALLTTVLYYVMPLVAFLSILAARKRIAPPDLWRALIPTVLVLASLESVLAVAQWLAHSPIIFTSSYTATLRWQSELTRAVGTFDSPLDLAAFLTMSLCVTYFARRAMVTYLAAPLLFVGVLVSGSRVGMVLASIVVVIVILKRSRHVGIAVVATAGMAAVVLAFLASPLADELLDRFGDRGAASTNAREQAFGTGLSLVQESPLVGHGIGYAFSYSSGLLNTSFENAFLATAIDLGVLLAVGLLALQLGAALLGLKTPVLVRGPALIATVWGFSYSSFVSSSNFGIFAWVFIALSVIGADAHRQLKPPAHSMPSGSHRAIVLARHG